MPHYEYRCGANGRTVEVRHAMHERLWTWGELATLAGTDPGDTDPGAPVERILSVPLPPASSDGKQDFRGCGEGCACARSA